MVLLFSLCRPKVGGPCAKRWVHRTHSTPAYSQVVTPPLQAEKDAFGPRFLPPKQHVPWTFPTNDAERSAEAERLRKCIKHDDHVISGVCNMLMNILDVPAASRGLAPSVHFSLNLYYPGCGPLSFKKQKEMGPQNPPPSLMEEFTMQEDSKRKIRPESRAWLCSNHGSWAFSARTPKG